MFQWIGEEEEQCVFVISIDHGLLYVGDRLAIFTDADGGFAAKDEHCVVLFGLILKVSVSAEL